MSIVVFNKTGFDIDISITKDYCWHSAVYYRVIEGKSETWHRASGLYKLTISGLAQATSICSQSTNEPEQAPGAVSQSSNLLSKSTSPTGALGVTHVLVIEATGNDTSLTIGGIYDMVLSHGNLYYDHPKPK